MKKQIEQDLSLLKRFTLASTVIWTIIIASSLTWNVIRAKHDSLKIARNVAQAYFDKDQAFRQWGASHGGVYVSIEEQIPPNPYLAHIPEYDITSSSGKKLTLMNPAYMMRQMIDQNTDLYGVKGKITSLKVLNPRNKPDAWERKALKAFEQGVTEVSELTDLDGQPFLRMIRPMITEAGCLKCHGHQGYKVGDVRGGLGLTVPMEPYLAIYKAHRLLSFLAHALVWALGLAVLFFLVNRGKALLLSLAELAEEKSKSESKLKEAEHLAQLGYCELDFATNILSWSDEIFHIFNLAPHEFVNSYEAFLDCVHPDDRELVNKAYTESVKNHTPYDIVHRILLKDGTVKYVNERGTTSYDESGKPIRSLGTVLDITERKKSEQALREKESRYCTLLEQIPDAIFVSDMNAHLIDANRMAYEGLGYTREELLTLSLCEVDPKFETEQYVKKIFKELSSGKTITMESSHRRKNGSLFPVEIHIGKLEINGLPAILGIARDISERWQGEEERRLLVTAIEQSVDSVVITDRDGMIQYVNPGFEQITGYSKDEVIGRNPRILQSGKQDALFYQEMWRTLTSGKAWRGHLINKKKDGTLYEEEVSITPVLNKAGEIVNHVAVKRDVTEQRKFEEQLRQVQKMEAIGTLAGGIAHDFNNILSAILGYSELAKRKLPPGTAAIEDIDQIILSGERATTLVQQILDFSRKTEQKIQPLQPHLIVQEVLQLLHSTLPTTVEIEQDIDPACGTIMADSTKLHQVILNLCTNAFQALKDEKGTLRITLSRQERAAKDVEKDNGSPVPFIVLSVSDTGQGMDPEVAAHIFEPYFTTKEQGRSKGTGLGLSIAHGIIEEYKGFIEVESTPGHGSTFRVFIPALEKNNATPEKSEKEKFLSLGTERILVVDDEPLLVRLNQRILEDYGYTVTGVTDSRSALEMVRAEPLQFDLLISDQTMPGLSGSELAKAVLEIAPDMPIIICTGHSAVTSAEDAYAMGIKKYICKPIVGDELARTVRVVLDEQKKFNRKS